MNVVLNPVRKPSKFLVVAIGATLLAACGGGGGGGGDRTGTLTVGITDAAVEYADAVVVQFTGVELKPRNGAAFSIDFAPRSLDLLALQGMDRALLLDGVTVPAGDYEWMRLKVNADPAVGGDSYVRLEMGGDECEMRIPSGDETGLKLVRGFTVGVGSITDFTIDFDLRKSVVAPPGQRMPMASCGGQVFMLKPALRLVDNLQVGAITGAVDPNLIAAQCGLPSDPPYPGNVYLFGPVPAGGTVVPDDDDGVDSDPNGADAITAAIVDRDTFSYTIGFVPAGNYVVAYTCDLDDPLVDADAEPVPPDTGETVEFTPPTGTPVTVMPGTAAEINFAIPTP
jgi:Domain of unknown function (DUF4382)